MLARNMTGLFLGVGRQALGVPSIEGLVTQNRGEEAQGQRELVPSFLDLLFHSIEC